MKLIKNETIETLDGIGPVAFEPLVSMRGTYWHDQYGRTHQQPFSFTVKGREYWGTILRTFDKKAAIGSKVSVDVELRTRLAGSTNSRALAETAKIEWRRELRAAFKAHLESFLSAAEARVADDQAAPVPAARDDGAKIVGTIDLAPTWEAIVGVYILCLENGTETGKQAARKELRRMAELADQRNVYAQRLDEIRQASESCDEALKSLASTSGAASWPAIDRRDAFRTTVRGIVA